MEKNKGKNTLKVEWNQTLEPPNSLISSPLYTFAEFKGNM